MEKKITIQMTEAECNAMANLLSTAVKSLGICPESAFAFNFVQRMETAMKAAPIAVVEEPRA